MSFFAVFGYKRVMRMGFFENLGVWILLPVDSHMPGHAVIGLF